MKKFLTAATAALSLFFSVPVMAEEHEEPKIEIQDSGKNLLVLGWDGVQRQEFWDCYNAEELDCLDGLPNIKELSDDNIQEITITDGQSCTKPGWAQELTGYEVETLGVYNNLKYRPIPRGYTVFERLEDHFGDENIMTVFIGGKMGNIGGNCFTPNKEYGEPYCKSKENIDIYQNALGMNPLVTARTLDILKDLKDERFFMFVQYEEPDFPGIHFHGGYTEEYRREMRCVDDDLGKIVKFLEDNGMAEDTIIYVITDHGADEYETGFGLAHRNAPFMVYATNDPRAIREADRMDFAPTFLEFYGINPTQYQPEIVGQSLYHMPTMECVLEGDPYIDGLYPGCCPGTRLIPLDKDNIHGNPVCVLPSGDHWDNSGYCTDCGNGICEEPENKCNCPEDCKKR